MTKNPPGVWRSARISDASRAPHDHWLLFAKRTCAITAVSALATAGLALAAQPAQADTLLPAPQKASNPNAGLQVPTHPYAPIARPFTINEHSLYGSDAHRITEYPIDESGNPGPGIDIAFSGDDQTGFATIAIDGGGSATAPRPQRIYYLPLAAGLRTAKGLGTDSYPSPADDWMTMLSWDTENPGNVTAYALPSGKNPQGGALNKNGGWTHACGADVNQFSGDVYLQVGCGPAFKDATLAIYSPSTNTWKRSGDLLGATKNDTDAIESSLQVSDMTIDDQGNFYVIAYISKPNNFYVKEAGSKRTDPHLLVRVTPGNDGDPWYYNVIGVLQPEENSGLTDLSTFASLAYVDGYLYSGHRRIDPQTLRFTKTALSPDRHLDFAGGSGTPVVRNPKLPISTAPTVTSPVPGEATNEVSPAVQGTGEPGAKVTVTENGRNLGSVEVQDNGQWSWTPEAALSEGEHTYSVTQTQAGHEVSEPVTVSFEVDTTAPAAPSGLVAADGRVSGQAEFPGEVTVTFSDQSTVTVTVAVGEDGSWSVPAPEGVTGEVSAVVKDRAGNTSDAATVTLTAPAEQKDPEQKDPEQKEPEQKDLVELAELTVTAPAVGAVTKEATPVFAGSGEPGAKVTVTGEGGSSVGAGVVTADGSWSVVPDAVLPEGVHTYSVTQVGAEGTAPQEPVTVSFEVDTTAPAAPSELVAADGRVSGQAEFPGEVTVTFPDQSTVTVAVGEDGSWSVPAPEGVTGEVSAVVKDRAGNTSDAATVTLTAPAEQKDPEQNEPEQNEPEQNEPEQNEPAALGAPIVTSPVSGEVTTEPKPTFQGTGQPGATVTVSNDAGYSIGSADVQENGDWSWTPQEALPDGEHTYVVTQVEGETVSPAATVEFTVDASDSSVLAIQIANADEVRGESKQPGTVTVTFPDSSSLLAEVGEDGDWSVVTPEGMSDGTVTAVVHDAEGTARGEASAELDTTGPADPRVDPTTGGSVAGNGDADSWVVIERLGEVPLVVEVGNDGLWSTDLDPAAEAEDVLHVWAIDAAGNHSGAVDVTVEAEEESQSLEGTGPVDEVDHTDDTVPGGPTETGDPARTDPVQTAKRGAPSVKGVVTDGARDSGLDVRTMHPSRGGALGARPGAYVPVSGGAQVVVPNRSAQSASAQSASSLARTGTEVAGTAGLSALTLVFGAGLLLAAKRRRDRGEAGVHRAL